MSQSLALAAAWLVLVNLWTLWRFASDKRRAREGQRRIPERVLLRLALLGGTPAAFLARALLRHKTRKEPFVTRLKLIAMLQAGLAIGLGVVFA